MDKRSGEGCCGWERHRLIKKYLLGTPALGVRMKAAALARTEQLSKNYKKGFVPPGAVAFIGSSTFTYWRNLYEDMAGLSVYNAAFGGSRTHMLFDYMEDHVFKYNPSIVVYVTLFPDPRPLEQPNSTFWRSGSTPVSDMRTDLKTMGS